MIKPVREPRPLEDPFRALAETAVDAVVTADDAGVIAYANPAAGHMFGRTPGELAGKTLTVLMPERFRAAHSTGVRRFVGTQESRVIGRTLELVGLRADGSEFPIELSIGTWTQAGQPHFTAIIRDVSERHRERDRIRHHLALLDGISDAVITFDPDLTIRSWSQGAEEVYGYSAPDVVGRNISDVAKSEFLTGSRAELIAALQSRQRWSGELVQQHKDGSKIRVLITAAALTAPDGSLTGIVSINRDVTEQRRVEQESRRLAAMVASSDDAIISEDLEGTICTWNRAAERLYGHSEREIAGRTILTIVPPDKADELRALLVRLRRGEQVAHLETARVRRDGTRVEVSVSMSPILDEHGRSVGISTIARDINEKKKLERQLMVTGRMASVGTLAAGVAHEINNPLAYVMTNLDTVAHQLQEIMGASPSGPMKEIAEMIAEAREGSERIRRIVRGLKTFSRGDDERRQPIELRGVLELAINMSFNELRHRARLVKDYGDAPLVNADESRLAQVFINLLVNSGQSLPDGRADQHEIRIATSTDPRGNAVVEIRDTGAGVPVEIRGRIFDPFFTTKPIGRGAGLGLPICHSIIAAHGGEITFETEAGKGTTFRVVLPPAAIEPTKASEPKPAAVSAPTKRGRILVVDDEVAVARALARIFRNEHEVTIANDGNEALERFTRGECFDAILCDLMMPHLTGMDLHDVLSRTRPDQAERMIFVTGGTFTTAGRDFLDTVPNARVEKPFDAANLRALVRNLLPK